MQYFELSSVVHPSVEICAATIVSIAYVCQYSIIMRTSQNDDDDMLATVHRPNKKDICLISQRRRLCMLMRIEWFPCVLPPISSFRLSRRIRVLVKIIIANNAACA